MQRAYPRTDTLLWAEANDLGNWLAPTYADQHDGALAAAEPALDLPRFRALLRELGEHPKVSSPGGLPYHVAELEPAEEEALVPRFGELFTQLQALRRAAAKVYEDMPGMRSRYVAATVEGWKDAHDLSKPLPDPLSYTGVSMQDLLYQVPEAISDFARIPDFANIQLLVIFGNDLDRLPFDPSPLTKLRYLALGDNRLRELPPPLVACKALEAISLGNNQLSTLPDWLAELPALRELTVRRNPLATGAVTRLREMLPDVNVIL
jgi:hypothetical protein